jgi:hypothetical protein
MLRSGAAFEELDGADELCIMFGNADYPHLNVTEKKPKQNKKKLSVVGVSTEGQYVSRSIIHS